MFIWCNEIGRFRVLFCFPPVLAHWTLPYCCEVRSTEGHFVYTTAPRIVWLETGNQNLWNFECIFCQCVVSVFYWFVKPVQNATFSLLRQTAGALLNTTSQLLTARRAGRSRKLSVQNTDRTGSWRVNVRSCFASHFVTPKASLSLPFLEQCQLPNCAVRICSCCVPDRAPNGPSERTELPRASELRNATSGIRTLDCRLQFFLRPLSSYTDWLTCIACCIALDGRLKCTSQLVCGCVMCQNVLTVWHSGTELFEYLIRRNFKHP